jgi:hypothetical protein
MIHILLRLLTRGARPSEKVLRGSYGKTKNGLSAAIKFASGAALSALGHNATKGDHVERM